MGRYKYRREDVLSFEEFRRMVEEANSKKLKALIVFLYYSGRRLKEALLLRKKDVTLSRENELIFRIPVLKRREKGPIRSFNRIFLPLNYPYMGLLKEWIDGIESETERIFYFSDNLESARVIVWREIKKLNPNCSPHLFRHTRATILARKGFTDFELRGWLGWADSRMAARYTVLSEAIVKRIAKNLI